LLKKPFYFFQIIQTLRGAALAVVGLVIVVIVSMSLLFNTQTEENSIQRLDEASPITTLDKKIEHLHFEEVVNGISYESFYEKDLEELLFLGRNSRPDAHEDQVKVLLGLKGSKQSLLGSVGERLYLTYEKGGLSFSKEPTSLWIKIKGVQNQQLQYDASLVVPHEDTEEIYQERFSCERELVMDEEFEEDQMQQDYFQSFEEVKWYHPDMFYEVYGGEKYSLIKGAERLEFPHQQPSMCFIRSSTVLIFKENRWQLPDDLSQTSLYPLAKVLEVTPSHMEVKIWDVSGMHVKEVSLAPERMRPLNLKAEEVFSKILKRTATQISCKIGSKNALLKKGDWLLRVGGNHWKPLKTWEEIEKYLSFELQGELFVFDGIEKKQGITVFKGHLFDTMREQMQRVSIPLSKQAKSKKQLAKKKGQEVFSESQQEALEEKGKISQLEEQDNEALLRLTTPQKRYEFSKQM
jgi:hypothetical protein